MFFCQWWQRVSFCFIPQFSNGFFSVQNWFTSSDFLFPFWQKAHSHKNSSARSHAESIFRQKLAQLSLLGRAGSRARAACFISSGGSEAEQETVYRHVKSRQQADGLFESSLFPSISAGLRRGAAQRESVHSWTSAAQPLPGRETSRSSPLARATPASRPALGVLINQHPGFEV